MANKITQLVNKDGDNLYPLAGGILSDSVATDMIQDGAVTSSKIDSTTLLDIPSGTQQSEALADSIYNYKTIRIYYKTGDGDNGSIEVIVPTSGTVYASIMASRPSAGLDTLYGNSAMVSLNGTTFTFSRNMSWWFSASAQGVGAGSISILRIVGYK